MVKVVSERHNENIGILYQKYIDSLAKFWVTFTTFVNSAKSWHDVKGAI